MKNLGLYTIFWILALACQTNISKEGTNESQPVGTFTENLVFQWNFSNKLTSKGLTLTKLYSVRESLESDELYFGYDTMTFTIFPIQ